MEGAGQNRPSTRAQTRAQNTGGRPYNTRKRRSDSLGSSGRQQQQQGGSSQQQKKQKSKKSPKRAPGAPGPTVKDLLQPLADLLPYGSLLNESCEAADTAARAAAAAAGASSADRQIANLKSEIDQSADGKPSRPTLLNAMIGRMAQLPEIGEEGRMSHVEFATQCPLTRASGLVTTAAVQKDDYLAFVPYHCLITATTAKQLYPQLKESQTDCVAFLLAIAHLQLEAGWEIKQEELSLTGGSEERKKLIAPIAQLLPLYIATLPPPEPALQVATLCPKWRRTGGGGGGEDPFRGYLSGGFRLELAEHRKRFQQFLKLINSKFAQLQSDLVGDDDDDDGKRAKRQQFLQQTFCYAWSTVNARGFKHHKAGRALVPLLDLANHHSTRSNARQVSQDTNDGIGLVANEDIDVGAEVTWVYEDGLSNVKFALYYGVVNSPPVRLVEQQGAAAAAVASVALVATPDARDIVPMDVLKLKAVTRQWAASHPPPGPVLRTRDCFGVVVKDDEDDAAAAVDRLATCLAHVDLTDPSPVLRRQQPVCDRCTKAAPSYTGDVKEEDINIVYKLPELLLQEKYQLKFRTVDDLDILSAGGNADNLEEEEEKIPLDDITRAVFQNLREAKGDNRTKKDFLSLHLRYIEHVLRTQFKVKVGSSKQQPNTVQEIWQLVRKGRSELKQELNDLFLNQICVLLFARIVIKRQLETKEFD